MIIEITEPNGKPYVSLFIKDHLLHVKMHRYNNVDVVLDKRTIPSLIDALQRLQNEVLDNNISR